MAELSKLFGTFRAEWLEGQLYVLFTEPEYFPELISSVRPCVLVGGRGTGKTTVLRGLSYEGQFALHRSAVDTVKTMSNVGLYYRADTNVVTAFRGIELTEDEWRKRFSHYFNLVMCDLIIKYLQWYEENTHFVVTLNETACRRITRSLNLETTVSLSSLGSRIDDAKIDFEAYINNVVDEPTPRLSVQSVPVQVLISEVHKILEFSNKTFIFLIDEFENFEDYQQRVVNTLIKHSGHYYSFKIGVRELGWRRRDTLNEHEQLIHPADYAIIDVVERLNISTFRKFAYNVCMERISKLPSAPDTIKTDVRVAFPGFTEDEEAVALGIKPAAEKIMSELKGICSKSDYALVETLTPLQIYFIGYWSRNNGGRLADTWLDFIQHRDIWDTRYGNYKHAMLYTINEKKRGIRKYYAGWDTLTLLAGGNIRFFVELFYESFLVHLSQGNNLSHPVSQAHQTEAAQNVGERYLSEIEGLSNDGAKLKKLVLSLGRIFQVMAAQPSGHAPEVNQFTLVKAKLASISNADTIQQRAASLINSSVMNLALIRTVGNKLGRETPETKDYLYMLHPIFNAFFVFSYRRKRKMPLTVDRFVGLVDQPQETIRQILSQRNREEEEDLPTQLLLWERFYNDAS
ncbi:MAG: hypothetical protein ACRYFS_12780 [Janthinobacterium lividum]